MSFSEEIHKVPFLRLLFPFVIGILVQIHFHLPQKTIYAINILLFVAFLISYFFPVKLKSGIALQLNGFCVYAMFLGLGLLLVGQSEKQLNTMRKTQLNEGIIVAEVCLPPAEKEKSVKATLEVIAIKNAHGWEYTDGKLMAYFEKDTAARQLRYGDRILLNADFREIEGPKNPEEFDYKKYMAFRLITKQSYIESGNWKLLATENGNWIIHITNRLRNKVLNRYKKLGIHNQEFAVLSALTLGYKDKLDAETKKSYAASGAMHMLAVSGLHIGIIYLILNSLLFFIPGQKHWKLVKVLLILTALWVYACMTGLPQSAKRASVMFSLVAIGNVLDRKPSIYNTLAASAFVLLFINPYSIKEVGFQLSYLAVAGIVFFQPRISSIITVNNKLLKWIWDLISVSIAAQIATAPIAMYYFHQFPNYFLLTNLIVIPAAFLLIYTTLCMLCLSFVPLIAHPVAQLDILLLKTLNQSVGFIESLPYAIIENISITSLQVLLLYLAIVLIGIFITYHYKTMVHLMLMCFIFFFAISNWNNYQSLNQQYFIIYNIHKLPVYNFIHGKDNILITNAGLEQNKVDYHIKPNWIKLGTKTEKTILIEQLNKPDKLISILNTLKSQNVFYKRGIFAFQDKVIAFHLDHLKKTNYKSKILIDYLVLSDKSQTSIDELINRFDFNILVFDSSVASYKLNRWIEACKSLSIPYYSVKEKGALVVEL